jgi:hypothetical protein
MDLSSYTVTYESYVGKTDWALDNEKKPFNKEVWKCNQFVRDALLEVTGKDIAIKENNEYIGYPTTFQMYDEKVSIPHLERINRNKELPNNISYVILRRNTEEIGGNHCGIFYNGAVYHALRKEVVKSTVSEFVNGGNGEYDYLELK